MTTAAPALPTPVVRRYVPTTPLGKLPASLPASARTPLRLRPAQVDPPLFGAASSALIVQLSARPDGTKIEAMPRGPERKAAAWAALQATATSTQAPYLKIAEQLKQSGAIEGYEALVSPNVLVITPKGAKGAEVIKAFSIDGVSGIYDNYGGDRSWPKPVGGDRPSINPGAPKFGYEVTDERAALVGETPKGATYGVKLIEAPAAWAQGATGKGMVFGSIDSGVDFQHPALKEKYRGKGADGKVNHDYSWMDFQGSSKVPVDLRAHGTHTIGSAVGGTADAQIGVAPEAKFIAVRGTGDARVDAALRSMQWMQAPTKTDGTAADATKAPDVVGLSWFLGSNRQELFRDSIRNLRLAGIEVVKSAGNNGPAARTITSPGHFPEIFAIAAVDDKGKATDFSSRGPALIPASNPTPKPDFAAPGNDIVSSVPGGGYAAKSGTSMAQPHFSGALLALMSKYPQLTHDQLNQVLAAGAVDGGEKGRDAVYGQGTINLPAALTAAHQLVGGGKKAAAKKAA